MSSESVAVPLMLRAPVAGQVVALEDVPDPVFAGKLVGPGVAIDPARDAAHPREVTALSPVDGTVVKVHPHAFVVAAAGGHAVLVHLGLDTVGLGGQGFTVHAVEGSSVQAGDPMVTWNPAAVEAQGLVPVVPVILLEAPEEAMSLLTTGPLVSAGEELLAWN